MYFFYFSHLQTAMTAKSLHLLVLLAGLAVIVENAVVKRHDDSSPASFPGVFFRGAVESPAPAVSCSLQFQRSAVEYRPSPDYKPLYPFRLKTFNRNLFLSQFHFPSLQPYYFRQSYPGLSPLFVVSPSISKGKTTIFGSFICVFHIETCFF